MPTNDNHPGDGDPGAASIGPHGQAALLLVESLIHILRERSVLTLSDTLDVVSTALEVQEDHAHNAGSDSGNMWRAHALLSRISASLQNVA